MKKTILVLLMTIVTIAAFSQAEKKEVKKEVKQEQKAPTDTLIINAAKVRFVKIGDNVHDLQTEIPLFLSFEHIISAYAFMDNSKSGLSKTEIEKLELPYLPYWQYYQKQIQSQKK